MLDKRFPLVVPASLNHRGRKSVARPDQGPRPAHEKGQSSLPPGQAAGQLASRRRSGRLTPLRWGGGLSVRNSRRSPARAGRPIAVANLKAWLRRKFGAGEGGVDEATISPTHLTCRRCRAPRGAREDELLGEGKGRFGVWVLGERR